MCQSFRMQITDARWNAGRSARYATQLQARFVDRRTYNADIATRHWSDVERFKGIWRSTMQLFAQHRTEAHGV
jgi:hypothetical protein